jgi:pyroglutamyl-peptidase
MVCDSPRILVTGFEPFDGADDNPSARIVRHMAQDAPAGLHVAVLPVSASRLPAKLAELLDTHRPDVVLGLGEARGDAAPRVERVAVNLLDFRTPDNDGRVLHDAPIVPGGPPAYFTTLPTHAVVEAICAAGAPCGTSLSAGAYLCNMMMYLALHWAARSARQPLVGFLHLPSLPTQNTSISGRASMELNTQLRAVRAVLECIRALRQNEPPVP